RHDVDARAPERFRILQRVRDAGYELVLATRQRREAAIAGVPITRRRIDEHDLEAMLALLFDEFVDPVVVTEREFDGAKPPVRRLAEALEERHFIEEKRQVGGEARHRGFASNTCAVGYNCACHCAPRTRRAAIRLRTDVHRTASPRFREPARLLESPIAA